MFSIEELETLKGEVPTNITQYLSFCPNGGANFSLLVDGKNPARPLIVNLHYNLTMSIEGNLIFKVTTDNGDNLTFSHKGDTESLCPKSWDIIEVCIARSEHTPRYQYFHSMTNGPTSVLSQEFIEVGELTTDPSQHLILEIKHPELRDILLYIRNIMDLTYANMELLCFNKVTNLTKTSFLETLVSYKNTLQGTIKIGNYGEVKHSDPTAHDNIKQTLDRIIKSVVQ